MVNIITKLPTINSLYNFFDIIDSSPCSGNITDAHSFHLINELTDTTKQINHLITDTSTLLQKSNNPILNNQLNFTHTHHHSKRQAILLPLLGTALFAGVLTGVTQSQIHSINNHLTQTDREVQSIKDKLSDLIHNEIIYEKNTAALLHSLASKTDQEMHLIKCSQFLVYYTLHKKLELVQYSNFIKTLFHAPLTGSYHAKLTPDVLNLPILTKLVNGHISFNNTLYKNHPETLYNVATITFVSAEERLTSAHFILSVPAASFNNFFPLYSIKNTGLYTLDKDCITFVTPEHAYAKDNTFYPIDLNSCKTHFNLHICPIEAFTDTTTCIQPTSINCTFKKSPCTSTHIAIQTQSGILFRNNKKGDSFYTNNHDKISLIETTDKGIAFMAWKSAKSIQIHSTTYTAPNFTYSLEIIKNFSTNFTAFYQNNITSSTLTDAFNSYFIKYNTSIENLLDLTHKTTHNYLSSSHPHIIALTASITTIAILMAIIFFLLRHTYRSNTHSQRACQHDRHQFKFTPGQSCSLVRDQQQTPLPCTRSTSHPSM